MGISRPSQRPQKTINRIIQIYKTLEEGYIKYRINWQKKNVFSWPSWNSLSFWREQMYQHHLIGWDPNLGVGFGNISLRHPDQPDCFIISGTQSGGVARLTPAHFTLVTDWDIAENELWCSGPVKASSESLTHAAVYEKLPYVQAVIHVHQPKIWQKQFDILPTTDPEAKYGTPEMARAVWRLIDNEALPENPVLVMGGHQDGLLAFGLDLAGPGKRLLQLWEEIMGK